MWMMVKVLPSRMVLHERMVLLLAVVCRRDRILQLAEYIWRLSDVADESFILLLLPLLLAGFEGRRRTIQQARMPLGARLEVARKLKTRRLLLLLLLL